MTRAWWLLLCAGPALGASLTSGRLAATIDQATGALTSLTDRRDGLALAGASPDRYTLQTITSDVVASETEDRVVRRDGNDWVATNPRLPGVTIVKRYHLAERWLEKRVEFRTTAADQGLLKHTVTTTAAPAFYRDGYLNDPSRHPLDYPYVFTRDLTGERPMRDSHAVADHHCAIYTSPASGRGLAQYRFAVHDRFVHPLSSYAYEPGLTYLPTGWRVAVACAWLSRERPPLATTCRWHLFDGDHLAFHQAWLALPEVRAASDFDSPAWLQDVKRVMGWSYGSSSFHLERYREAVEALDGGVLLVMIGEVYPNTRRYLADPLVNAAGLQVTKAEIRRVVDGLHAISPRIKVGPITWQWGFGPHDPVFREHPEWTVHDPAGEPVFAASGWADEKVFSQLLTPECRAHNLAQFRGLVRDLDFDFIYMDTGQGGVTRFDWRTQWGAQDYDWADFYRGIREAARSNRNGPTFFNGSPQLYSQEADCGYFEGLGFVKVRDWRAMSDRLLLVKLYQPGDKWTMPLYWRQDNADDYLSYCLLFGLRPGDFAGTDSSRRWPLTQAARELRATRLVPAAEARPCWWKETTETEAYALSLPGGALLNLYHHGAAAATVSASCLLAPLGLDQARPVQAWLFRPRPVASCDDVRLTETDSRLHFEREGHAPYRVVDALRLGAFTAADGRLRLSVPMEPGRVALVMLTQAPRLAHVLDGRPTQLLLPAPDGVAAETVPSDQPLRPELIARRTGYQLPAGPLSPALRQDRSTPATVNREVTTVNRAVAGLQVTRLVTLDCEHNGLDRATATALPDRVRLVADSGDEKLYGFASAGCEATNAGRLTLRAELAEPLYRRFVATATASFVGLVADYHTAAGYARRVRFCLAPCRADALTNTRPWWGLFDATQAAPQEPLLVDLSDRVKPGGAADLTIDLGLYAPAGWDGQVLFGPVLESCGLGSRLTVEITANGPAGRPDPKAFSPLPIAQQDDGSVVFQGAAVKSFEDGAKLVGQEIQFPPNACVEGSGFRVLTWRIRREAAATHLVLMVNYQLRDGSYRLVERDLSKLSRPGAESRFDLDLGQFAPPDWNGRIRMRLRGDGFTASLVANSTFQLF